MDRVDRLEQAIVNLLENQIAMQNQLTLSQTNANNQMASFQNQLTLSQTNANNQMANFNSQMTSFQNQMTKLAERQLENDKGWFEVKAEQIKIREELNQIIDILRKHTAILENLPNAIKERIGFKG
jgi:isopenicillin N synthase-like dioxygenase